MNWPDFPVSIPKLMKVANGIQSAPQDALKALGTDGQKQFIELTKKEIENSYSDILKWFATK